MSKRTDAARRAHQDLTTALPGLGDAIARLMDSRAALPGAVSTDGAGGRSTSSSTETLALTPDPANSEIRQLDRCLQRLEADALWLARFTERHTPRPPSPKDQAEVARVNAEPLPECWWLRRHTDTFEVALCTTNLGGLLDEERPIGRWVYDFARRNDRLPTVQECQRHAAGQTVRVGA